MFFNIVKIFFSLWLLSLCPVFGQNKLANGNFENKNSEMNEHCIHDDYYNNNYCKAWISNFSNGIAAEK